MEFPYVNREQSAEYDRIMVEELHVPVIRMMVDAGARLAEFVRQEFGVGMKVLLCCGKGNNGGDGIAAAQRLVNMDCDVRLLVMGSMKGEASLSFLETAIALGIPIIEYGTIFADVDRVDGLFSWADVVVDCLLGYNISGELRKEFKEVVGRMNGFIASGGEVVSCDLPTGVDCDEGVVFKGENDFVRAQRVLYLSLPKIGGKKFAQEIKAKEFVGDIGVPKVVYERIGVKAKNYFRDGGIVEIKNELTR